MTYRGYTEAQNKATQKYVAKTYDRFVVTIRKEDSPCADDIRAAAAAAGMSANEYIKTAVWEKMERDARNATAAADRPTEAKSDHKPMKLS